jgi:hypothetical protein
MRRRIGHDRLRAAICAHDDAARQRSTSPRRCPVELSYREGVGGLVLISGA